MIRWGELSGTPQGKCNQERHLEAFGVCKVLGERLGVDGAVSAVLQRELQAAAPLWGARGVQQRETIVDASIVRPRGHMHLTLLNTHALQ